MYVVCSSCAVCGCARPQPLLTLLCPPRSLHTRARTHSTDAVEESGEEARALVAALLEHSALELLVQALSRFDEANEDEAAGVNKALSTIENMAEVRGRCAWGGTSLLWTRPGQRGAGRATLASVLLLDATRTLASRPPLSSHLISP